MNNFPTLNFQDFIVADGDNLTTDSLKVSAVFCRGHDNVLKAIRKLIADIPPSVALVNFNECFRINELANGKREPYFRMTRDGFVLLVMGFTGKKALGFKVAYIEAFNDMARYIKNQRDGLQYRYFQLELEHKNKKAKASFHGRGLNEWKGEKPVIEGAIKAIEEKMNPQLPFMH